VIWREGRWLAGEKSKPDRSGTGIIFTMASKRSVMSAEEIEQIRARTVRAIALLGAGTERP
jgi:hypothetical protein